jgi:hypothetical protein
VPMDIVKGEVVGLTALADASKASKKTRKTKE